MCSIQIGKETIIFTDADSSILEAMERNNIPIESHCKNGYCGVCRTKRLQGEVDYHIDPLAFFNEDEFLPCCSTPNSDLKMELTKC